jgi:hypothetical protein
MGESGKVPKIIIITMVVLLSVVSASAQTRRGSRVSRTSQPKWIELPKGLLQQLIRDDKDVRTFIDSGIDNINSIDNFSAQPVDLNGDRRSEFIIYSPPLTGNSSGPIWIYRRTASGYEQILYTGAMLLEPLNTSTKGYRDLVSSGGGNAMGYFKDVFKFNGRKYVLFSRRTNKNRIPS